MASFFISHSSHDAELASSVRAALMRAGYSSVFLDFEPENGIPAGHAWERELYAQLRKADVLIFLATAAAMRSCWCHTELALGRSLGRSILPVLLDGGRTHPLLSGIQGVRLAPDGDGMAMIVDAVVRLGIVPLDTLEWDPDRPPYPGLLAFDESRAGVYYGREPEVAALLERLTWPMADAAERLVMVVGASGSGKSSLMRAGVLPRIRLLADGWIVVPPFTPEDRPVERLARSLARAFDEAGSTVPWQDCHARLDEPIGLAGLLDDLRDASRGRQNVLVAIDQGEQLATRCAPSIRTPFLERLATALQRSATTRVMLTLRSEYLSGILASTPLEGQAATTMPLGRLAPARLAEVIEKPAQRAGIDFEAGLVARMVEETRAGAAAGGDALPLLAFLLRRVYDLRADPTRISRVDYEQVGGVGGAIRVQANRVRDQLAARDAAGALVPTLLALVHLEAERDPTGRSVPLEHFDRAGQDVVRACVEAGLLTTGGEGPTVRVAHEALFTEWPLISRAIGDSREALLARSRLDRDAREWAAADRDPSYLIGGGRLRTALRAYEETPNARADAQATRFLAASRKQARRSAWRGRALIGLAAIVVVSLAGGALMYALDRVREVSRRDSARSELITLRAGAIDAHEVTYAQYRLCILEGACQTLPSSGIGPDFDDALDTAPVVFIDANQAHAFCAWIDRRLPRVAELRSGAFANSVAHLLEQMEGREWTSTRRGIALQTVARNLDARRIDISAINGSQRDLDLGFRCAA